MSEPLPALLEQGVRALRERRWDDAVAALQPLADDPDLSTQPDLTDIHARICSLLAQALLEGGRPRQAEPWARRALKAAEALGDATGAREVRSLHQRVFDAAREAIAADAARATARALATRTVDEVLDGLHAPAERAAALVAKANADLDDGRPADGAAIATRALAEAVRAGDVREEVLARLTIARALPEAAAIHLHAAWERAVADEAFTLVGAVARAAELAGVPLAVVEGPMIGEDR